MATFSVFTKRKGKGYYSWRKRRLFHIKHIFKYPGIPQTTYHEYRNSYGNGNNTTS